MSTLHLRIFDGSRQLFAAPASFLVTITDGNQTQHIRDFYTDNDITFDGLPFFDNFGDNYTVIVWAKGFQQAGFTPVLLSDEYTRTLDIMLISNNPGFSFVNARFPAASAAYPFIAAAGAPGNATNEALYDGLVEQEKPLACLLNICEAMSQIQLTQGTPLTYMKQLIWGANAPAPAPAQDRFFAWCDPELINQIISAPPGQFAVELNPGAFHLGATRSWKQIEFGEANVQFTFHENEPSPEGTNWVMLEPDIDYYRDLLAHTILEVIPNALDNSLTDPAQVYVLRWIAGQTAGIPEFAPLYTIT
jgi:hypothetical protein